MRKYKMRSDSAWSGLNAVQREKLDDWLFTEHLGYKEVLERVQTEFGITASTTSLCRYYQLREEERAAEDLAGADRTSNTLNGMKVNLVSLRESSLKLIGRRLQKSALAGAEIADLTALGRLLLEAQWRGIQENRLELAREKFHFDAAEAALAEIPHVGELTAEELQREKARVDGIITRLFGKKIPPGYQVLPQANHVQSPESNVQSPKAEDEKTGGGEDGVLPHGHQEGGK
jgi:hypothetical protein